MKVVVMNLNGRGGMLHYSSQFSNALCESADIRVVVPTYTETKLYKENIILWKIRTNPTLVSFFFDTINIFAHIGLIYKIAHFRPDIFQILDNHPWYIPYAIIGKILGAKIYVIQHDPFPHSGERSGLFHQVAILVNSFLRKYADRLIVHGEKMREKVCLAYHIDPKKIISIYHGSYDVFENHDTSQVMRQPRTFLFFGRIVAYKGLEILLAALKNMDDQGIPYHAIIAGEGDIRPYEKLIHAIKSENITLENRFINDSEIATFFGRSQFVVLPYKDATASGIIPLAYSFRIPVIATKVGVLPDYVVDRETGILIGKENIAELEGAIVQLLDNPKMTENMGEKAFLFQKDTLSWKSIIDSIFYAK